MYLFLKGCKITLKENKIDNSGNKKLDVKEQKKKSKAKSEPREFRMISIILEFLMFGFSDYKAAFISISNCKLSIIKIIEACLMYRLLRQYVLVEIG